MDKTTEWCPYCEQEVELNAVLELQTCPNCKEQIIPCTVCKDMKCGTCELSH